MFTPTTLTSPMANLPLLDREDERRTLLGPEDMQNLEIYIEFQICRRKLESKNEALMILKKEMDECRSERDQFKLMAEQLRERYQAFKKQLVGSSPAGLANNHHDAGYYMDMQNQSLVKLLCETKENNKSLQFEADDLRQKLADAQGDIKLLREQIARQRVGTTDEGINTRHFPAYEREDLVAQLEAAREQYVQLERDLQQVLDEKEEQVTERDAYKTKYERLNTELNYILKGDEKKIVDIDALVNENKYLLERLKQMEEEKTMAMATVSKYKSMLERKKNKGILKLGQSRSGGLVISQKQVQHILQSQAGIPATPQSMADLQGLCSALLDTINDKSLALSHQRKTNKILGNRVSELEKKLKTLEVAGLWNVPGTIQSLAKLKAECEEMKMLVPRQMSQSSENSDQRDILDSLDSDISSVSSTPNISPAHKGQTPGGTTLLMEDLDLLPTKEECIRITDKGEVQSLLGDGDCSSFNIQCSGSNEDTTDENPEESIEEEVTLDDVEDKETAEKLKTLMEDVTAKIKEQSHGDQSSRQSDPDEDYIDNCEDPLLKSETVENGIDDSKGDNSDQSASPTCDQPLLEENGRQDNSESLHNVQV
ncbi:LOW QUALITY PROTEIN: coiled-coil domain-containing protein 149-B-like [Haliotis rubra]|uniref:LOW QUALITY PROTEIN: coiled-coil domain-containing protein 149-B-like n=1 Tax=Haliotis rubra TaxID=36100 RepID=UPI001EE5E804|nr:LOW QUALITY PROTEIN: coiled-coil domain-containing protein 149-B-like [Haliotis rubra]